MSLFLTNGAVQSRFTNISNSYPCDCNSLIECKITEFIDVESLANVFGRINGTFAPNVFAIEAIFLSSVETTTS